MGGRFDHATNSEEENGQNMLARFLNAPDVGGVIARLLFADGHNAVLRAAITSTKTWAAITDAAVRPPPSFKSFACLCSKTKRYSTAY